jgi:hypothetical protein
MASLFSEYHLDGLGGARELIQAAELFHRADCLLLGRVFDIAVVFGRVDWVFDELDNSQLAVFIEQLDYVFLGYILRNVGHKQLARVG